MPQSVDTTIIGRDAERAVLEDSLARTERGSGQIVLMSGDAGVGKTRLVEDVLADCRCQVLTGRAREESNPPYGPIAGVLRDCLRLHPADLVKQEPLLASLAHLLPELGPAGREMGEGALVEAIVRLITMTSADFCCVIFLEDLHWADTATLELLIAFADRFRQEQVIVIGTYLPDDLQRGHPLRRIRNELRRARRLKEIAIGPLPRGDSAVVIARALGRRPLPNWWPLSMKRQAGSRCTLKNWRELWRSGAIWKAAKPA